MQRVPITQKSWDSLVPGTLIKSDQYPHWWEYVDPAGDRKKFRCWPECHEPLFNFHMEDFLENAIGDERNAVWQICLQRKRRIV